MQRTLKPIRDFNSYSIPIARSIYDQLCETIFSPLMAILRPVEKINQTTTALESALRRGVMEYRDGYFVGPLNIRITKELRGIGAIFNNQRKVYYLEIGRLPQNILQAIAAGNQASQAVLDKVHAFLRAKEGSEIKLPVLEPFLGEIVSKLDKQFFITTKPITSADLEVPMRPELSEQIKGAYTQNLEKYIQQWNDEAILRLREKVEQNVREGYRAESLISIIRSEQGVSQRKARFLAKQETSLMTASYTEIRYKDIGINDYIWACSLDERTRPDHRRLHGHLFRFDHPPIEDTLHGKRGNPGEGYGCRCRAIPYLRRGINMVTPQMGGADAAIKRNIEEYATR